MTLDQVINRLQTLRETMGGDTPFCIQKESTPSTQVTVFESAGFDAYNVVDMTVNKDHPKYACLMNGNTSTIVAVF